MQTRLFLYAAALLGVGFLTAAETPKTVEPNPELVYAERVLKDVNIRCDAPALLAFFKARSFTPAQLTACIDKLGDDRFEVRERGSAELVAAGRRAVPSLRLALKSRDREVAARARRCLEDIERVPEGALVSAAARLLAEKNPKEATDLLLGCLPGVEDEQAQEAVLQALERTALKDGSVAPTVRAAVHDKEAIRRIAAAFVLGRGNAESRRHAAPLLTDPDARVRFHAAVALVRAADKEAVPPLLALLTEAPVSLAWQTEDLLCQLAGDKMPAVSLGNGNAADRRTCQDAWKAWWKDNGEQLDLTKIKWDEPTQHLTLVAEVEIEATGRIWECGPDGKPRWEFKVSSPTPDARVLSGGRVLVAELGANRVTERDYRGNILWEYSVERPLSCQRLPNGNTFIATQQGELKEVTMVGQVVFSYRQPRGGSIYHAEKLSDGRIYYINRENTIYELDANGRVDKTISTNAVGSTSSWASAERLANGNYLVACYASNKVAELNHFGLVVWECEATKPGHALRLSNGNTLVACVEEGAITEYNRAGNAVWSVKAAGRPFYALRR
jgi:hypothetical protein